MYMIIKRKGNYEVKKKNNVVYVRGYELIKFIDVNIVINRE